MISTPISFALLAALFLVVGVTAGCASTATGGSGSAGSEPVLRHVVLFKFKDTATQAQIDEIVVEFGKLPGQIPEIIAYEHGVNVSTEDRAKGFTHGFLVTFKDEAGLAAYLPHPAHQAFVAKLKGVLDEPLVFDYWTSE